MSPRPGTQDPQHLPGAIVLATQAHRNIIVQAFGLALVSLTAITVMPTNSSPPIRATVSLARADVRSRCAAATRT